mmetsp:Transcript_39905/g.96910  ORF Transcript_39905/g.96910 Transcript_39905/m.96910 type:complete len:410 (+) Transcript_39905:327-1556(+)
MHLCLHAHDDSCGDILVLRSTYTSSFLILPDTSSPWQSDARYTRRQRRAVAEGKAASAIFVVGSCSGRSRTEKCRRAPIPSQEARASSRLRCPSLKRAGRLAFRCLQTCSPRLRAIYARPLLEHGFDLVQPLRLASHRLGSLGCPLHLGEEVVDHLLGPLVRSPLLCKAGELLRRRLHGGLLIERIGDISFGVVLRSGRDRRWYERESQSGPPARDCEALEVRRLERLEQRVMLLLRQQAKAVRRLGLRRLQGALQRRPGDRKRHALRYRGDCERREHGGVQWVGKTDARALPLEEHARAHAALEALSQSCHCIVAVLESLLLDLASRRPLAVDGALAAHRLLPAGWGGARAASQAGAANLHLKHSLDEEVEVGARPCARDELHLLEQHLARQALEDGEAQLTLALVEQ